MPRRTWAGSVAVVVALVITAGAVSAVRHRQSGGGRDADAASGDVPDPQVRADGAPIKVRVDPVSPSGADVITDISSSRTGSPRALKGAAA
jgi:hypothetical protein